MPKIQWVSNLHCPALGQLGYGKTLLFTDRIEINNLCMVNAPQARACGSKETCADFILFLSFETGGYFLKKKSEIFNWFRLILDRSKSSLLIYLDLF